MITVRALDSNHDWTFGKGKNNYLIRNAAIAQNIDTRLNSFLGDCFFDIAAGIDWFNLLGAKDRTALNLAISAVILNTEGVTSIVQVFSTLTAQRLFTVQYEVNTIYTGLTTDLGTVQGTVDFLTTESGSILSTEDGDPIIVT